jgi:hypothetical protein
MARIKVLFNGMTTLPDHTDGECRALVNLRPKNGIQKPVPPRKVIREYYQPFDIVFVHRGNDYENWIYITRASIYYSPPDAESGSLTMKIGTLPEKVNSVEQFGNVLSFVTDSAVYYAIWKDNLYISLGMLPAIPAANFSIAERSFTISPGEALGVPVPSGSEEEYSRSVKAAVYVAMQYLTEGGIDKSGNEYAGQGQYLMDAHILRYAYRLYDGSVIKYSPPILLMPSSNILTLAIYIQSRQERSIY